MKSFSVLTAFSLFIFAGCERHPVAQLQEINERSEVSPEKTKAKAGAGDGQDAAQPGQAAKASASPRGYFPADAK